MSSNVYYPKDKNGNTLSFRTPTEAVYDTTGKTLKTKLGELREAIDAPSSEEGETIPNRLEYNANTFKIALKKDDTIISSDTLTTIPDRISYDEETSTLTMYHGETELDSTEIEASGSGTGVGIGACSNIGITADVTMITLTWEDPDDVVESGVTISTWSGTKLVYKTGGYPEGPTDGNIILDSKTRNQYSSTGFTVSGLTEDTTYYFRLFPYSNSKIYNKDDTNKISGKTTKITVYGFYINMEESDPDARVVYTDDAVGMTPAYMDFENDVFNYGSWENAFFMPRPCMLKFDGTVDYYLDPDDYTKKEDGTASDIADASYEGNAMMEFPKVYVKRYMNDDDTIAYYKISDKKVDEDYECFPFYDKNGNECDVIYLSIYESSIMSLTDGSTIYHSCSGQSPDKKSNNSVLTISVMSERIGNNYLAFSFSDLMLVYDLSLLISKTTDSQQAFGLGMFNSYGGGTHNTGIYTNDRGLFYGYNDLKVFEHNDYTYQSNEHPSKIFGIENLWENCYKGIPGIISMGRKYYIKPLWSSEDGTGIDGFGNTDYANNYIDTGISADSSAGDGYLSHIIVNKYGSFPIKYNGSGTSYFSDYGNVAGKKESTKHYLLIGASGTRDNGYPAAGLFRTIFTNSPSYVGGYIACKPPKVST